MSYLVLARKYRPQTFEEVVGQEHVTTTLSNAISAGRVAHAILFSGPRGTGKTTVARILAKTINCEANREIPSSLPCNTCRSCTEITNGSAVDVYEIDGASNNSVDQVRELRDNVRYMPAHSPYKIYIIDEVHMLSLAAFNALLKTLEEPPEHVKFMFATTEPHKIPITILSRCQRHDMRRVDMEKLVGHLASLCRLESMDIEEKSLSLIAQEAGGSVRDALSLLDQVISCSVGSVDHDQVLNILGTVDRQVIFDLSSAMIGRDPVSMLETVARIYDRGHDLKKLFAGMTQHFRNLLVVKMTKNAGRLVDSPPHEIEMMQNQAGAVSVAWLTQITDILFAEEASIRFSAQPRLALEVALLKIYQIEPALSIDTLIEKLDRIQQGGTTPSAEPGRTYPDQTEPDNPSVNETAREFHQQTPSTAEARATEPMHQSAAGPPQSDNEATTPPIMTEPPNPVSDYNPDDPPASSWKKFLRWYSAVNRALAPSLYSTVLNRLTEESIDIEIGGTKFNIQRVLNEKNRAQIETACREYFKSNAALTVTANYEEADQNKKKREQNERLKQETMNNPVVSEAIKVFEGTVDIKLL